MTLAQGSVCEACNTLYETLCIHTSSQLARKKKKKKRTLQRIRAPLQSSQQNKVETHCRAKTSVRRSKVGLLARNKVLLKELEIRKDKMKSVKN